MKKIRLSKKPFTVFSALATAFLLQTGITDAQITLTQSDFASIGDTILMAQDNAPGAISVGGTGMQTWDFRSLNVDDLIVNAFVNPNTTAADTAFPTSNIAVDENGGNQISYGTMTATQYTMDGYVGDPINSGTQVAIQFNPPRKLIEFPSALNDSFQDTSRFEFYYTDPQLQQYSIDSIRIIHYGDATRSMDAYGTMITPADTFDCLRQHSVEIIVDSIFMHPQGGNWILVPASLIPPDMGFSDNPNIDTLHTFTWYANGEGMSVAEARTNKAMDTVLSVSFKITDKVVAGLFDVVHTSCMGDCDGSAEVTAISGYAPYTYTWDSAAGNQTTAMATGLCDGTYTVTITDNAGNVSSASVAINEPAVLTSSITVIDAQCDTCHNGSSSVSAAGGTAPFTYSWSSGQTTAYITSIAPGNYFVTVTDKNGCTISDTAVVGFWPVGIQSHANAETFSLYPNPASNVLFITSAEEKTISLVDMLGKTIYSAKSSRAVTEIDLTSFQEGIYYVKIANEVSSKVKKVTVIK